MPQQIAPGFHSAVHAQDPFDDATTVEVRITRDRAERLIRRHPIKAWQFKTAQEVLKKPDRIYRGIRDKDDGAPGFAYCGLPVRIWRDAGPNGWRERPRGMVFMVCLDSRMSIFDWMLVRGDPVDRAAPIDWKNRFQEQTWPKTA